MSALLTILWFLGTCVSVWCVFHFIGFTGLTNMFPEGRRDWHLPAQLATLAVFATFVLNHPFTK
jgi:hypothetical protein